MDVVLDGLARHADSVFDGQGSRRLLAGGHFGPFLLGLGLGDARVGLGLIGLQAGADVVVYCVYGHEVGRATALRLRSAGLNARYLRGGIDGWQAAGRPVQEDAAVPGGASR